TKRCATNGSNRRIEPISLVNYRSSCCKTIGKTIERTIELPVCLGLDAFSPFARLRQKIQSPGNTIGSRFLAGGNESQNIRTNFWGAEGGAAIRIARLEQQRQDVMRRISGIGSKPPLTPRDNIVNCFLEKLKRGSELPAARSRHHCWHTKDIERIDAPDYLEIGRHRGTDFVRVAAKAVCKNSAFQHVHSDACRLVCEVHYLTITPVKSLDQRFSGFVHRCRESQHCLAREQRR